MSTVIYVTAKYPDDADSDDPDLRLSDSTLGLRKSQLRRWVFEEGTIPIAQFLGIVEPGLILAKYIFLGNKKLIYTWRPQFDCEWRGDRFNGNLEQRKPPQDMLVFAVTVTQNNDKVLHPNIMGWIESWGWVAEAMDLSEAPVDWKSYPKVWTRQ